MVATFEFDPFPRGLYTAKDLFRGFEPSDASSFADTLDMRIYGEFVRSGRESTDDYLTAVTRALHDTGITQHVRALLAQQRRGVVGIMGGHRVSRRDPAFEEAAALASAVASRGFLVTTGGGPGAMEAAHLGAAFAGDPRGLEAAITALRKGPPSPPEPEVAARLVRPDGTIDRQVAKEFGEYLSPAHAIATAGRQSGLGVPTWLYGDEAVTPFAAQIAKYFQNSIREDGLLALATHGIVYLPGGAGTLQEVFQDAAQNYYHLYPQGQAGPGFFSPMVFFGDFWNDTLPIKPVLDALFKKAKDSVPAEYERWVTFTSDISVAIEHLESFEAPK